MNHSMESKLGRLRRIRYTLSGMIFLFVLTTDEFCAKLVSTYYKIIWNLYYE